MPKIPRTYRPCSFAGCERPLESKGLCNGHRQQQKRGKPLAPLIPKVPVDGICSADECDRRVEKHGYCSAHYARERRGLPMTPILRATPGRRSSDGPSDEARFFARIQQAGDCWRWIGPLDVCGYGRWQLHGRPIRAHRWAYTFMVGEIPAGLDLDHLCRNRACVNPDHLEPVTRSVNVLREWAARRQESEAVA